MLVSHIFYKGLVSKPYKEFLEFKRRKYTTQLKNEQRIWTGIFPTSDTVSGQKHHHRGLVEKNKAKPWHEGGYSPKGQHRAVPRRTWRSWDLPHAAEANKMGLLWKPPGILSNQVPIWPSKFTSRYVSNSTETMPVQTPVHEYLQQHNS